MMADSRLPERKPVKPKLYVMANPEIVKTSTEVVLGRGRLPVHPRPGGRGRTLLPRCTSEGQNRRGQPMKVKAEGWLARIFQHEVDHINGVVFPDRATQGLEACSGRGRKPGVTPGAPQTCHWRMPPRLRQLWADEWSGETMIVHGEIFRPEQLEGFVADDWTGVVTYIVRDNACEIISLNSLRAQSRHRDRSDRGGGRGSPAAGVPPGLSEHHER